MSEQRDQTHVEQHGDESSVTVEQAPEKDTGSAEDVAPESSEDSGDE